MKKIRRWLNQNLSQFRALGLVLGSLLLCAYQGSQALRNHNHTGPTDGGSLSNLSVTGSLTPSGVLSISSMTATLANSTATLTGVFNCVNLPCTLFSGPVTSTNSYTIAGLPGNGTLGYHLQIECSSCTYITGVALRWLVQLNGDAGANYTDYQEVFNTSGIGAGTGHTAANFCTMNGSTIGGASAGQSTDFLFDVWTSKAGAGTGQARQHKFESWHYDNTNSRYDTDIIECIYTLASAQVSKVTFFNSGSTNFTAGTLTVRLVSP